MFNNFKITVMKKKDFLWSLLAIVMAATLSVGFISCGDDDDDPPVPTLTASGSISIDEKGTTSGEIIVTAENTDWSVDVTNGKDWLTAYKNGNKVSVSAKENTETTDRTGIIVVTATADSRLSQTFSITQKGASAYITVNGSTSGEHTFPGGFDNGKSGIDYKQTFKIKSNVQWTLSGKVDWLNISPTSGNGDVDLTIYPTSENTSDKDREATITLAGTGISIPITIIQHSKWNTDCYVIPANEVALYDRFCWEYTASASANNFQYLLLSEREYNRLTDNELREEVMQEEVLKYDDGWLSMTGYDSHNNRITSNTTYYFVSLATDKDGNYGALKKIKLKTPAYLDADQDAYVSFANFDNTSYSFQFDAQKEGYCNTYHIIYGVYDEYMNTAVFAFEINYYLKNKQKHWLAKNEYYEWEIITDYPNNHTFSYSNYYMWYFTVCFGYGWGVFKDGSLSSDLLGFQVDTDSDSAPQMKARRMTDDSPKNVIIKKSEVLKRAKSMRRK